jgi:GTP cyclohydrolase II
MKRIPRTMRFGQDIENDITQMMSDPGFPIDRGNFSAMARVLMRMGIDEARRRGGPATGK